jgi:replicative DNA helicase
LLTVPHGIISVEQPAKQLLQRYSAGIASVNGQSLRLGTLSDDDWRAIADVAIPAISEATIYISDSTRVTVDDIARIARRWKFHHGIRALFIDYIQRIRPARPSDNRANDISDICRELKSLATELDIPVIALAQFNRGMEQRGDHYPTLADLKGSGALEEEADCVIAVYRPSLYDDKHPDKRLTQLILLKNRHGPLGFTKVDFVHEFMRFEPRGSEEDEAVTEYMT